MWRFLVGAEAAGSVLATALYQNLGVEEEDGGEDDDPLSPKLLVFSDSRQDAAFFAPYLNRTHDRILRRSLILETLRRHEEDALCNLWRRQDLVAPLAKGVEEADPFPNYSLQRLKNEAWKWVFQEFLAIDRRNSLEGLGLMGFSLVKPKGVEPPGELLGLPWNLNSDEAWTLVLALLDTLRTNGAILFPDYVYPTDEASAPRNKALYVREEDADSKRGILSWNSSHNVHGVCRAYRCTANLRVCDPEKEFHSITKLLDRVACLQSGPLSTYGIPKAT